jgi:hypothetical protein
MNIPDRISERLDTIFCVKILAFFDPESLCPGIRDGKHADPEAGINIPDP